MFFRLYHIYKSTFCLIFLKKTHLLPFLHVSTLLWGTWYPQSSPKVQGAQSEGIGRTADCGVTCTRSSGTTRWCLRSWTPSWCVYNSDFIMVCCILLYLLWFINQLITRGYHLVIGSRIQIIDIQMVVPQKFVYIEYRSLCLAFPK